MKTPTMIVLVILFAGCVETVEEPGSPAIGPVGASDAAPIGTPEPDSASASMPAVRFGTTGSNVTKSDRIDYFVEADGPVSVDLTFNGTAVFQGALEGNRTWALPLDYGRSVVVLAVAAGNQTAVHSQELVRLGLTRLRIDYGVFHPNSQGQAKATNYEVWVDVDARPSEPLYRARGAKKLDNFTAHDQLVVFTVQSRIPVEYQYSASFQGFTVTQIDGAGNSVSSSAPPWWCYAVNARSADGISIQRIRPGDAVVWTLGTCS